MKRQGSAGYSGDQPLRGVTKLHGKSQSALQQGRCATQGLDGIARVYGIDQVGDEFAIAAVCEVVAPILQLIQQSQLVVNLSMMKNRHARQSANGGMKPVAEIHVGGAQQCPR